MSVKGVNQQLLGCSTYFELELRSLGREVQITGSKEDRPAYICIDKACQVMKTAIMNQIFWQEWKETTWFIVDSWLGGYESILKCMTVEKFNWFLHVMLFYHVKYVLAKKEKTTLSQSTSHTTGNEKRSTLHSSTYSGISGISYLLSDLNRQKAMLWLISGLYCLPLPLWILLGLSFLPTAAALSEFSPFPELTFISFSQFIQNNFLQDNSIHL